MWGTGEADRRGGAAAHLFSPVFRSFSAVGLSAAAPRAELHLHVSGYSPRWSSSWRASVNPSTIPGWEGLPCQLTPKLGPSTLSQAGHAEIKMPGPPDLSSPRSLCSHPAGFICPSRGAHAGQDRGVCGALCPALRLPLLSCYLGTGNAGTLAWRWGALREQDLGLFRGNRQQLKQCTGLTIFDGYLCPAASIWQGTLASTTEAASC